jgi:hypothetical protein
MMAVARTGCCTSLLYGMSGGSTFTLPERSTERDGQRSSAPLLNPPSKLSLQFYDGLVDSQSRTLTATGLFERSALVGVEEADAIQRPFCEAVEPVDSALNRECRIAASSRGSPFLVIAFVCREF